MSDKLIQKLSQPNSRNILDTDNLPVLTQIRTNTLSHQASESLTDTLQNLIASASVVTDFEKQNNFALECLCSEIDRLAEILTSSL